MKDKKQKEVFLDSEGDNWYHRNKEFNYKNEGKNDLLLGEITSFVPLQNHPLQVLEIGCGNGWRLKVLQELGYQVSGIDPSHAAIEDAKKLGLEVFVSTADELPFKEKQFDVVVFGFCLYLCDREDLFKISSEANRVLKKQGYIFILDFYAKNEITNDYHHAPGLKSYKMDYKKLFDWHPDYTLIKHIVGSHQGFQQTDDKNDLVAISILRKF